MEHETLRELLKVANLAKVSRASGAPYHQLYRFVNHGTRPSHDLISKVESYYERAFRDWLGDLRG